jgi:hypothetical protein
MIDRVILASLAILALPPPARAVDDRVLCEGSAFVTGTRDETRAEGLAHVLRDVLVKRSGDPALSHDARVDPLAANAGQMVEDYLYLDRLSDQPKHDEQGTRDRPFTLIARFAPAKIDAALASLGDMPWLAERPALLARVTITDSKGGTYPLSADGGNDERHRQALLAAAIRFGMHLVLEPVGQTTVPAADTLLVTGTLRWSDADAGWVGAWRSGKRAWGIKGVSFDDAYRDLVWGAMAIASGHALPEPR